MPHFELIENVTPGAVIKVIGVGGCGGNAVAHMMAANVAGVEFIAANTDAQDLHKLEGAAVTLALGQNVTRGLGAGANPEVGKQAAMEDRERIIAVLQGADMLFITAGMGGGTGTGAAPVIAQLARELGILTVGVVTRPFRFEGRRPRVALKGIEDLSKYVDSLITIPNDKLIAVLGRKASVPQAFAAANKVLQGAVQGIADLIVRPGEMNVDFADIRAVMGEMGLAMMGSGIARGDDRAQVAVEAAINNPLLDDVNLSGAKGLLINITASADISMGEFEEINETVTNYAAEDATVFVGTAIDPDMQDEVRVTVVATGLTSNTQTESRPSSHASARANIKLVHNAPPANHIPESTPIPMVANATNPATSSLGLRRPGTENIAATASMAAPQNIQTTALNELPSDYLLNIPAFLRRQAD